MVKNPPAKAADTVLIPGLGRSHMLWAHMSQLQSPCSMTGETTYGEAGAPQGRLAPAHSNRDPVQSKIDR